MVAFAGAATPADRDAVVVQGPQHQLVGGVQFGGDLGGGPFPGPVQLPQQRRIQVLAIFPAGAGLDSNPGGLQPGPDEVSGGVVLPGDLLQGAALGDVPAVQNR
jgi:hypothetical protein